MSLVKGLLFVAVIAGLAWFAMQRVGPTHNPRPPAPVQVNVSVPNPVPGSNQDGGDNLYVP
jgi:hypothetical protein